MATYLATKNTSGTNQMPGVGDGQSAKEIAATYTFGTAPAAADTILSPLIQAGSVITSFRVHTTCGGTYTVGFTGQLSYLISGGSATVQTINVPNAPFVMPANGNVIMTLAGTPTAGIVSMFIGFTPLNA